MGKTLSLVGNKKYVRYQGREFETTLQAPTLKVLNKEIKDLRTYARKEGMGRVRILQKGPDPDGGFKAIVTAHNWNPVKWVKGKLTRKKPEAATTESQETLGMREKLKKEYEEQLDRERTARATAEDTARKYQFKEQQKAKEEAASRGGTYYMPSGEEMLGSMPERMRKKYGKKVEKAEEERAKAAFEAWEQGVPAQKKVLFRTWNPTTQQHEIHEKWVPLSPAEQAAATREAKLERAAHEELLARVKQAEWERRLKPVTFAAKTVAAAASVGVGMAAAGTSFGPRAVPRGRGTFAPAYPVEMYTAPRMMPTGMGPLGSAVVQQAPAGAAMMPQLGALRQSTLPNFGGLRAYPMSSRLSPLPRRRPTAPLIARRPVATPTPGMSGIR